jgi:microcystin-dependent protein
MPGKTVFSDIPPQGTIVTAAFLNAVNNHRHTGRDIDGDGALDYATTTGSNNAYVLALTPALDAYVAGVPIVFKASFLNTGAATININGLGAVSLKKNGNANLAAGDIQADRLYMLCFDGTNLQVIAGLPGSPIGGEMMWPTETPPLGWLEENGAAISRTTYAGLFAIIGTMYGAGNGSTTFNLPDARGRFVRGWDHGAGLDPDAASRTTRGDGTTGDNVGTNQANQIKSHSHLCSLYAGDSPGLPNTGVVGTGNSTSQVTALATGGNETRPINTNRMLIIKAY